MRAPASRQTCIRRHAFGQPEQNTQPRKQTQERTDIANGANGDNSSKLTSYTPVLNVPHVPVVQPPQKKRKPKTIRGKMSANFNPYVQGWRVGNGSSNQGLAESPSIFGALPMTSGGNAHATTAGAAARGGLGHSHASDPNATVFHITDFRPNVLNASVVDARGRQCYKIVTDAPQQPQRTVYYDSHRRTVAIVDWAGSRPSVEMPGLLPRQALRSWLHTGPDRAYVHPIKLFLFRLVPTSVFLFCVMSRSRVMEIRGISHIWVPNGEFICVRFAFASSLFGTRG
jgi:hypothetical protein